MVFFITTSTNSQPKQMLERIIESQEGLECAICCSEIDKSHPGVVNITCGGMADLEHLFCEACDKKFEKNDPYKREIVYRFVYPFRDDKAAVSFIEKSSKFILSEDDEEKHRSMVDSIKSIVRQEEFRDVCFDFDLGLTH
ncbi:ORF143 [Betabaculovirus altermyunipunctae]|uniref:ORF143 n=1 Tax=Betabaculovirus altermyunipunctae TaxID=3051996 RepID=A0A1S5YE22_9BBAC|nr:ORF143 [Betabaculovirus altermyunipunctae]AQQ80409.1 ORF143 [Betabaculovirus altermyunipunctae]